MIHWASPLFFIPATCPEFGRRKAGISLVATTVVNWEIPLCRGMKKGAKLRLQKTQRSAGSGF